MKAVKNCFTLVPDVQNGVKLLEGIAAMKPWYNLAVLMRAGRQTYRVPVISKDLISPSGNVFSVFEADFEDRGTTSVRHSPRLVHRRDSDVTLLVIETRTGMYLNHIRSQPHFPPETTLWLGAEGQKPPAVQFGRHSDTEKSQLFRLEEGEHIFFFDDYHEVTKITARIAGETPRFDRATNQEVAAHVLWTARERGRENRSTIAWCFHALQELGCQKEIDEFQQLFPDFRVRAK